MDDEEPPDAEHETAWSPEPGLSGDPLLKRLVDLAQLGFSPRLTIVSNGMVINGTLVSATVYRSALASSLRQGAGLFATLDGLIAAAIDADEPGTSGLGSTLNQGPEPRFIHLADVTGGLEDAPLAPFLRLRLPAVSGFWLTVTETE